MGDEAAGRRGTGLTSRADSTPRGGPNHALSRLQARCERFFDALYSPKRRSFFLELVVRLSLGGLVVHMLLVFLARSLPDPPAVIAAVGTNYLAALYTPFSFILFYEVLLLILAIPESTTRSIGKQYEILSLVVIRNVFKDIAEFESVIDLGEQTEEFAAVLWDMGGGLAMFLLVIVFYHVNGWSRTSLEGEPDYQAKLKSFISRKKVTALVLSALLFGLAAYSVLHFATDVVSVARFGSMPSVDVRKIFYVDFFSIMVFADAAILILSLRLSNRYDLVFRNAAFVVSTILLRFSIAMSKPYDVELGVGAMAFGTLVVLIYQYSRRIRDRPPEARPA